MLTYWQEPGSSLLGSSLLIFARHTCGMSRPLMLYVYGEAMIVMVMRLELLRNLIGRSDY